MKFGFNYITDEAREKLEELGITHRKEDTQWIVFTESFDIDEDWFREHGWALPPDFGERFMAQGTRVRVMRYKSGPPEYFYLIKNVVFKQTERHITDYSADTPTVEVKTLFDVIEPEYQDYWRDWLMKVPPNADKFKGGQLI